MNIKFLGHACFHIELDDCSLLFDPFISPNELASHIDIDSIDADYILLSHGHQDHIHDAEAIAKRCNAKIISTYEVVTWFGKLGIEGHPMNHGGSWEFDFGTVKMVNAVHTSSFPDGSYAGNPAGFVINTKKCCFYFAGDTALTMDMQLIPMICPKLDFAFLPIGDNFTMGYEDAILASDFIDCTKIIPFHYDTFGYIQVEKEKVSSAFEARGKELLFLEIGETVTK
jgi:L-ascorbate metabolism protein UlaG (beta-lactamase superfamily)